MPSQLKYSRLIEMPKKKYLFECEDPQLTKALASVGELMASGETLHAMESTTHILHNLLQKINRLFPILFSAVFLFNDDNKTLELKYCLPKENCVDYNKILNIFLDTRIIEKTLQAKECCLHSLPASDCIYLVQRIATHSKKYGIIIVKVRQKNLEIISASLQLFSILLQQCATSLENFTLFQSVKNKNNTLLEKLRAVIHSEATLHNSQRMLHLVLENVPQCVFWKDVGLTYMGCNHNFAQLVGYEDSKDIMGHTDAELRWDDQELFFLQATDQKVLEYGTAVRDEFEISNGADGSSVFMDIRKMPLINSNGQTVGILGTMQNITDRKAYERQLNHMALHDGLTDLPNRTLFHERLERAIQRMQRRNDYKFAVLMLDMDRFKLVNDTFGHLTGDEMLIEVAQRIQASIRSIDTVCRLGGDEFAILLEEYSRPQEVISVVERLELLLKTPYELNKTCIFSSASIGVVLETDGYSNPEMLLRDADIAMYCAKENNSGSFTVFNEQMHHRARRIASLSNDMFTGLERGEFFLTYQPIFRIAKNEAGKKLSGLEVLLRWQHPEQGIVLPAEFLPFAEESGFIIDLGEWILRTACNSFAVWRQRYAQAASLNLAINISTRQLNWSGLKENILGELRENGLKPESLSLEFAETAIMSNADATLGTLRQFTDAGISLSIDDFGTGYSSLSYLFRLPVDRVKIDKSLIETIHCQPESAAIVNTMISLAANLNLAVVAEGVEHAGQYDCLVRSGCTYAQGNLFSPPLTTQEVEHLLANGPQ